MGRGQDAPVLNRQLVQGSHRRAARAATAVRIDKRRLAVGALALGSAIAAVLNPARAVTLGELQLESTLGQPLSARVPVVLQAGESLVGSCVTVPAGAHTELGTLPRPVVTVPETAVGGIYDLRVTTTQALYEPMYELHLQVRCPGTALVVRQYVLMLDLPGTAPAVVPAAKATVAVPAANPPTTAPESGAAVSPRPRRTVPASSTPLEQGTHYRVQAGDTLSTIAARVHGGQGLWATVDAIFAANPAAFIGGNPDLIKLGSEITIPQGTVAVATPPPPVPQATADVAATATVVTPPANAAAEPPAIGAEPAVLPPTVTATVAAPADAPAATVFADEQSPAPPVTAPVTESATSDSAVAAPADRAAPAWLAVLVGMLIGALASIALLRDRLLSALRNLWPGRAPATAIAPVMPVPEPSVVPTPAPVKARPSREPSMVVEEHTAEAAGRFDRDALPAGDRRGMDRSPAPAARDLNRFSGVDPVGEDVADVGAEDLPDVADLDLDLSAATPDGPIDEDIGWLGDDTSISPTEDMPRLGGTDAGTIEHIDLQTLSQRAVDDDEVSRTLRDALDLLENDYEANLTASQVIDQSKLNRILADEDDDTLIRTGTDQLPRR